MIAVTALLVAAPFAVVLGVAQDGGYPQAGDKTSPAWSDVSKRRKVACIAIVDPASKQRWMLDATPDFKFQLHALDTIAPHSNRPGLDGIFLTHGHMGHYTGLLHLGREALGADRVPVYAMPRMRKLLVGNAPWEMLVREKHILLRPLKDGVTVRLNERLSIRPFLVPHRDEYTETVGFVITGPSRSIVFLPDIDKWTKWDAAGGSIEKLVAGTDVAYLDGTFFEEGEIPGRNMKQIPHPFIVETMRRFAKAPLTTRTKIRFLHLNRTNPALDARSKAARRIEAAGFGLAVEGERQPL